MPPQEAICLVPRGRATIPQVSRPAPPKISEIVLTGGSCAGKTESIGFVAAHLRNLGFPTITVPEVATMIITGGIPNIGEIAREDGQAYCDFQREVFLTHRALRVRARSIAAKMHSAPAVILYDRGELDGLAYHAHDCFDGLAREDNTTIEEIRQSYDAVIHLVTTAHGAEAFYSDASNSARWDTLEEARRFDRKIVDAWKGNHTHFIIDNRTNFAGKTHRIIETITSLLDYPSQLAWEFPGLTSDPDTPVLEMDLSLPPAAPH